MPTTPPVTKSADMVVISLFAIKERTFEGSANILDGEYLAIPLTHKNIWKIWDLFRGYYDAEINKEFSPLGAWDCQESPWGKCVYHHASDRIHDCCLYCGKPEERK